MELLQGLLNLIYPPRCLICSKILEYNDGLCEQCFEKIEIIKVPFCNICGKPLEPAESFIGVETQFVLTAGKEGSFLSMLGQLENMVAF